MKSRFAPPQKSYAGYVFDCDGTLVDTMPLHYAAWVEALARARAGIDFTWDLFVSRAGMSLEQTVRELAEQFAVPLDPVSVVADQRRVYQDVAQKVEPVTEVVAFAESLHRAGLPLAVASGSEKQAVVRALQQVGVLHWFRCVLSPSDVERGKPFPDMFLLAATKLGKSPETCLVIEDGEMGIEAARRAGMDYAVVGPPLLTGTSR
jgi:HAD superfamily hydrolase (TIGR01509 family)